MPSEPKSAPAPMASAETEYVAPPKPTAAQNTVLTIKVLLIGAFLLGLLLYIDRIVH